MARLSYLSCVPPTWQMIAGGSFASSRYIGYSVVPGGVVSRQGSSFVPVPVGAIVVLLVHRLVRNNTVTVADRASAVMDMPRLAA